MVFVRDEGSVYNAPLEEVWRFLSSASEHTEAHQHRHAARKSLPGNAGHSASRPARGRPGSH